MKRWLWTAIVLCGLCGCDEDPARSLKIVARPASASTTAGPVDSQWRPRACPPPAEKGNGAGSLKASGPCAFEQKTPAKCRAKADDFFAVIERPAAGDAKLTIFLNVEKYHGPDNYLLAQVQFNLQDGNDLYRWTSDNVAATVGADEAFVELPTTRLDSEPLMNTCPPIVNPDGSYKFPCEAKRLKSSVDGTTEVLSGKIVCK